MITQEPVCQVFRSQLCHDPYSLADNPFHKCSEPWLDSHSIVTLQEFFEASEIIILFVLTKQF